MRKPPWNPACGLPEMKTVSFMLCAWFTSTTSCWRAVTLHLGNMSLVTLTVCTNGGSGSHECSNTAAHKSHKPTINTPKTWRGFEISFTEYAREISIITLPSHRRRDRKYKVTPLELSQLRALSGQLLWLGMKCLPQLLAHLSLLMGQTPQATVGTIYKVIKLARKATAWTRTPLNIHAHHSLVVVTYTDAGWTTRPDGTSQGGQLVFIANSECLQGRESNMSLISWHSSRQKRVAKSSSAAETNLCGWRAWLAVLAGEVLQILRTRQSSVEPTTGQWETTEKAMCGSSGRRGPPGTAAAPRMGRHAGGLVLTPYHLRPARRLWLQVWLTSEFLPLVEYLELALDAIAVACAAKLGVGNEMEGFVRSPAWALLRTLAPSS